MSRTLAYTFEEYPIFTPLDARWRGGAIDGVATISYDTPAAWDVEAIAIRVDNGKRGASGERMLWALAAGSWLYRQIEDELRRRAEAVADDIQADIDAGAFSAREDEARERWHARRAV